MRQTELIPEFVDQIPEELEDGKIYVCRKYKTATHLCACGCGKKVVTPFKEGFWTLTTKEADSKVTMRPSIGNFNLPCKSHYFLTDNKVEWL